MDEMAMRGCIVRKREGHALTREEWNAIVTAYMEGVVDESQMAALLMACVWRDLSIDEATALTRALVASGQTLHYDGDRIVVDKHSSGGVSDIVSLVAVPIVAACGVRVGKLSGRALGHTGGTIDKLECIEGLSVSFGVERFIAQVESVGCAIVAQSDAFVPADKRLYRLRDRTGTVASMGLIAASIVSKKISGGANAFVFDVKCGSAAFMKTPPEAIALAQALVEISRSFGRRAVAIVSDMNEPLGRTIGSGIELIEAREFLRGNEDDARARDQCLRVAAAMLELANIVDPHTTAAYALSSGIAYDKFVEMIEAQGGSRAALEALKLPEKIAPVIADSDGFLQTIDATTLGNVAREWSTQQSTAGIRVMARIGDRIAAGQPLAQCYGDHAHANRIAHAFIVGATPPEARPLVYATL